MMNKIIMLLAGNPQISHAAVGVPADGSGCDPEYQCIVYDSSELHRTSWDT